ncbi:hypothetical protein C0991_003088 [Blastosporella zonata]|nr:hypothetical protein C0991_003088 [Blastosporella zonata]
MAQYHYDEAGNMAAYFLITFLALVLVPTTLLSLRPSKKSLAGCQCQPCIEQRQRIGAFRPKFSKKTYFLIAGWSLLGFIGYKVAHAELDNKIYDPFEILGIKMTIRENLEKYGNPDGRVDVSMGIAIPKWIVEGKNNVWVLGFYGIVFGGALPALVVRICYLALPSLSLIVLQGRWWFGNRQKTKDSINALSAAAFFKTLKEESTFEEVLGTLGKAFQYELATPKANAVPELDALEKQIQEQAGLKWNEVRKVCGNDLPRRKGLILLYAHLLRLDIQSSALRSEQRQILLQAPLLLNALLNIATSRNWLSPSVAVMRLHAYLTQALLPGPERVRFAQLPGIKVEEATTLAPQATDLREFEQVLIEKHDTRMLDVRTALSKWGRAEIVDAAFKAITPSAKQSFLLPVIGERVVTPSSIVFLVVKLRLSPPRLNPVAEKELDIDEIKRRLTLNEEKDEEFLIGKKEAEETPSEDLLPGWVHAPFWPGERKPSWWIVLGDEKSNRVVVPPMKITEIPFARPNHERDYRSYKIQFQAPQNVGVFTWRIQLISDSFVHEDTYRDIILKIEDASTLPSEDPSEDEISDPDEDTIAGQMAAMRGGPVKKKVDDESDDESSTDDDNGNDSSSDSDSD